MKSPQSPRTRNAAMVRAKIMCGLYSKHGSLIEVRSDPGARSYVAYQAGDKESPVAVLPRSREAQEAMLNQAAKAVGKRYAGFHPDSKEEFMEIARACLAAVGIVEAKP